MSAVVHDSPMVTNLKARGLYDMVKRHAASHFVTVDEILGRGRSAAITAARHEVWRELRLTTPLSTVEIGRLFDRDHSSVLNATNGRRGAVQTTPLSRAIMRGLKRGLASGER